MTLGRTLAAILLIIIAGNIGFSVYRKKPIRIRTVMAIADTWATVFSSVLMILLAFLPWFAPKDTVAWLVDELSFVFVLAGSVLLIPHVNKWIKRREKEARNKKKTAIPEAVTGKLSATTEDAVMGSKGSSAAEVAAMAGGAAVAAALTRPVAGTAGTGGTAIGADGGDAKTQK